MTGNSSHSDLGVLERALAQVAARLRFAGLVVRHPQLRGAPFVRVERGVRFSLRRGARVDIGRDVVIRRGTTIDVSGHLSLGDGCFINERVMIVCLQRVALGAQVLVGEGASIHDENHVRDPDGRVHPQRFVTAAVVVGDHAWIGAQAVLLPGCSVGPRAVVGGNSTVVHDIPAGTVAVGSPARPKPLRSLVPVAERSS